MHSRLTNVAMLITHEPLIKGITRLTATACPMRLQDQEFKLEPNREGECHGNAIRAQPARLSPQPC
jgi:hypothetical protein